MSVTLGAEIFNYPVMVDGWDIGTVGYSYRDGYWWLHWGIRNEGDRGKGYGTAAVLLLLDDMRDRFLMPLTEALRVMVRPWNDASLALARKVGFAELSRDDENVVMEYVGE